jgi:hypothetical protein
MYSKYICKFIADVNVVSEFHENVIKDQQYMTDRGGKLNNRPFIHVSKTPLKIRYDLSNQ